MHIIRNLSCLTLIVCACIANAQAPRPNIIHILADDIGYGDVGFNGQTQILTPNLDQLAAEGMVFTQHYSGSTVCTPSRACLMAGLHSGHVRMNSNGSAIAMPQEEVSVAEILRGAGYATHFLGKWGLGGAAVANDAAALVGAGDGQIFPSHASGIPSHKGFDTSLAYLNQAYAHYHFPVDLFREDLQVSIPQNQNPIYALRTVYSHDNFETEALQHIQASNGTKPFYIQASFTLPHRETKNPPAYDPYAAQSWPVIEKAYAAMMTYLDDTVGQMVAAVDGNPNIAGNTLIIFTGDNGAQATDGHSPFFFNSNGAFRGNKRDLYEGGIRMPTVMRWVGTIPGGTTSSLVSANWDYLPTFADLAGARTPNGIDGISFAPTLTGIGTQQQHAHLYWETDENGGPLDPMGSGTESAQRTAVRQGDWKLVVRADSVVELYNLASDPGETTNVAASNIATRDALLAIAAAQNANGITPTAALLSLSGDAVPVVGPIPTQCAQSATPPSTKLYWRFDNDGGAIGAPLVAAVDASASGNNGASGAGPVYRAQGFATVPLTQSANNRAVELNGTSQYIEASSATSLTLGLEDFTIEAWVKLDTLASATDNAGRRWLTFKKPLSTADTLIEYAFMAQAGDFAILPWMYGKTTGQTGRELALVFGNGIENWGVNSSLQINDTAWHYVAVSVNAATREARFVLDEQTEIQHFVSRGVVPAGGPLVVGAHHNTSGVYNQFLDGQVDEIRLSKAYLPFRELLNRVRPGSAVQRYVLDFGTVNENTAAVTKTFKVKNGASSYAWVLEGAVDAACLSDARLSAVGSNFEYLVDGAESAGINVTLTPSSIGALSGQSLLVQGVQNANGAPASPGTIVLEITGTVADVNEAPTAITPSDTNIDENAGANAAVCTLATTDPDNPGAAQTHTYTLVAGVGSTDNALFNFSGNTLRATAGLNFESAPTRSVRIRSTDNGAGNLFFEQSFVITVNNLNEAPTAITPSDTNIDENAGANAAVCTLATTDPDNPGAGQAHTYTLVAGVGSTDNALFNLSGNTLRATASLNFEVAATRSVRIRSTDNGAGNLFFEQTFVITVINLNEAPTAIAPSALSIGDAAPNATLAGTLAATDIDGSAPFVWTLLDNAGGRFAIGVTTGEVSVANTALLDAGSATSHTVSVEVRDAGGLAYVQSVTVSVTDTTPPTAACRAITANLNALGSATITASAVNNGSIDNVGVASVAVVPSVFGCGDLGANSVTLTVADAAGNTATCAANVTVVDVNAPLITPTGSLSVALDCGDSYTELGASASDACENAISLGAAVVIGGNVPPGPLSPGVYTVTYDVSDTSGNQATRVSRTVTVQANCALNVSALTDLLVHVPEGDDVTMAVSATGAVGAVSFQWQQDDNTGQFQDLPGETQATLQILDITQGGFGRYRCVVSDSVTTIESVVFLVAPVSSIPALGITGLGVTIVSMVTAAAAAMRRRGQAYSGRASFH